MQRCEIGDHDREAVWCVFYFYQFAVVLSVLIQVFLLCLKL